MNLRLAAAVYNNAAWCEAVCAAHGLPGTWLQTGWLNTGPTPPFYPNLVTLGGPDDRDAHLAMVERLLAASPAGELSVKDSFATLDLTAYGFEPLFEAEWLWLEPGRAPPAAADPGLWTRAATADALAAWERAWRDAGNDPGDAGMFPSSLLRDEVAFLGGSVDGRIAAGAIANRSKHRGCEAVGLSNIFLAEGGHVPFLDSLVESACSVFPGLPIVGYERDEDAAAMKALGFEGIGRLRVWLRPRP